MTATARALPQQAIATVALLFQVATLAVIWSQLPARVPVHFGVSGLADAWGGKATLLLLPAVSAVIYGGLAILRRYPQRLNYPFALTDENAPQQHVIAQSLLATLNAVIMSAFAYVTWTACRVALGRSNGLGVSFLPLFLGAVAITLIGHLIAAARAR